MDKTFEELIELYLKERQMKGIWIPIEVLLDHRMNLLEKILFSFIAFLSDQNPTKVSNDLLSDVLGKSDKTISHTISALVKKEAVIRHLLMMKNSCIMVRTLNAKPIKEGCKLTLKEANKKGKNTGKNGGKKGAVKGAKKGSSRGAKMGANTSNASNASKLEKNQDVSVEPTEEQKDNGLCISQSLPSENNDLARKEPADLDARLTKTGNRLPEIGRAVPEIGHWGSRKREIINTKHKIHKNIKHKTLCPKAEKDPLSCDSGHAVISDFCTPKKPNNIADQFDRFWSNMAMRKTGKAKAKKSFEKITKKMSDTELQAFTDRVIFDTQERFRLQQFGFDLLHPTTYLNGERWEDELVDDTKARYSGNQGQTMSEFMKPTGMLNALQDENFMARLRKMEEQRLANERELAKPRDPDDW